MGGLDGDGYGRVKVFGQRVGLRVHRFVWEQMNGPVPDGLVLDHLCFKRHCCNPHHLEPVTPAINARRHEGVALDRRGRLIQCKHGHPYPENAYLNTDNRIACRSCGRENQRRYRAKRKALAALSDINGTIETEAVA